MIDVTLDPDPLEVGDAARTEGYDGVWLGETAQDPLLGCASPRGAV
jgi:hypothetical protein